VTDHDPETHPVEGAPLAPSAAAAVTPPPPPRPGFARRHWGKLTLTVLLGTPVLGLTLWGVIASTYVYSTGTRTGYAQKLSRKGWICKTWEGELAMATVPGVMPEKFLFTVWSDSAIAHLQRLEGKRVTITYEQHRFLPNDCFGETEYWVTDVRATPE
jgi:hypothetical protein